MGDIRKIKIHDEKSKGYKIPKRLKPFTVNFGRNIDAIHTLELPVVKMPIYTLLIHLYLPWFFLTKEKPFSLEPIVVIENPKKYPHHYKKIINTDTSFPIDILWWNNKWLIMDGLHRLCKLYIQGAKYIQVRIISNEILELIKI